MASPSGPAVRPEWREGHATGHMPPARVTDGSEPRPADAVGHM